MHPDPDVAQGERLYDDLSREQTSRRREARAAEAPSAAAAEAAAPHNAEESEAAVKSAAPPGRPRAPTAERSRVPMADRPSGHLPAGKPRTLRAGPPGRAPP